MSVAVIYIVDCGIWMCNDQVFLRKACMSSMLMVIILRLLTLIFIFYCCLPVVIYLLLLFTRFLFTLSSVM